MLRPIVKQVSPSQEQRPAITVRGCDVVVTAGAGAGKTRTLVARYLALLDEGLPLRSIVAITFTKKAAREMRNRVREEVRRYLNRPDLDAAERQRWLDLYGALDAARIGTIHSLCTEMLRAYPAEAAVDPRFEVLDEGQGTILRSLAIDEALAWAVDDAQAVQLFAVLGERELRVTLETLVKQRLDAAEAFGALPADPLAHWEAALAEQQALALRALLEDPRWNEAVACLRANQADKADDLLEVQRVVVLGVVEEAKIFPLPNPPPEGEGMTAPHPNPLPLGEGTAPHPQPDSISAEGMAMLTRLDGINLRGGSSKAWPGGREQVNEVKDALRMLRELWRERAALLMLTLNEQDRLLAALLPALKALFNVACAYYDLLKDLRSALDFDDLEGGALDLVAQRPAVQARWQRDLKAVLVDEFQDTNGRQRDLLSYLNDTGSKLFIVGDAKQSIYRFRGADVAVFRAERARIADEGGAALSLETSYRAHRPLVQGLNDLLLPVLGDTPDAHRPWAEPFAPLQAHREAPAQGLAPPYIEAHLALGSKQDGALLRAAQALTMRLMALVEGGDVRVPDEGEQRPLHYGDIAILCRASTSFSAYEDALEQAGVPFLTVAGRGFYGRPEIRDLLNALQALADPTDDLALAGLLRSPALALSDAGLYHLCEQQEPGTALWDVLRNAGADLPGVDGPRAVRAVQLIAELHGQVGRAPVADLLKAFLDRTDYGAALLQAGQERARRNIAKLLADAHASGIVSVGEFLDYVNGLRDTGAREGEARAMAENAVQIMSVHAAKGLEFPIVVIGDVSYANRRRDSVHVTPDFGVLLSLKDEEDKDIIPAIYKLGKERAQDQEAAESDRLFYVAATRAKELLILSGIVGQTKSGNLSLRGWLKQLAEAGALALDEVALPDQEPEDAPEIHSVDLTVGQTPVHCAFYFAKWAWQPPHIATPEFESPDAPVPPPLLASITPAPAAATPDLDPKAAALSERSPPQRVWRVVPVVKYRTAPAWVVGSLVHEALAMWRFPDGDFRAWAEARARAYGITDRGQLDHAVRESRRLLSRFQKHPFYTEMDGAERRLHEVPYSLEIEEPGEDGEAGGVTSGIIDALYLQDGTWTIIEFKTDRLRNEADLHKLFAEEDYLAQARRYRVAVQRLLGQEPRVVFCMLNYGREIHLHWLK